GAAALFAAPGIRGPSRIASADTGRSGATARSPGAPGGARFKDAAGARSAAIPEGNRPGDKAAEHRKRADALILQGRYAEAEGELLEADRLRQNDGSILDRLAAVELKLGKGDRALATLERLIRTGEPFDDKAYTLAAQTFIDLKMA